MTGVVIDRQSREREVVTVGDFGCGWLDRLDHPTSRERGELLAEVVEAGRAGEIPEPDDQAVTNESDAVKVRVEALKFRSDSLGVVSNPIERDVVWVNHRAGDEVIADEGVDRLPIRVIGGVE